MTLDLMADMDTVFLDNGFEESITAIPPTGSPVSIKAQVFRAGASSINLLIKTQSETVKKYDIEVYVSRTDVPIAKVSEYKFQFKKRLSDTSDTTFIVSAITREDEGALRLGLS
jgi:hypothetical protein